MYDPTLLFGPVGPEVLIILLLIVLLFGAGRIPKLARSTGEAIGEFRRGREETDNEDPTGTDTPTESRTEESTGSERVDTERARVD